AVRSASLKDAIADQLDGGKLCFLQRIAKAVAFLPITAGGVVRDKAPTMADGDPELAVRELDDNRAAVFLAHQVSEPVQRLTPRLAVKLRPERLDAFERARRIHVATACRAWRCVTSARAISFAFSASLASTQMRLSCDTIKRTIVHLPGAMSAPCR